MQLRTFKILPIVLLLLLIFLQYRLWFDSDGILHMHHLKKQLARQMQDNAKLKQRNEELFLEVRSLQTNQDSIESHARQELGMIKKDEMFYQVTK
jgi:cell division protein FtsB